MPTMMVFLLGHFATGASLGLGLGCMMLSRALGPAAMVLNSTHPTLAILVFLYAIAGTFGIGFLTAALAFSGEE